jgi:MFS family permease
VSEPAAAAAVRPRFLLARSLVVIAVAVAMIGSSAPSPIYGLYQARLHLDHVWLTAIYGAYSVGTVFALFVLGRISDRIGDRRLLLFAALAATLLGALIMAFAHGLPMLLTGRFFAGMGTGCIMGPATAALVELDPARDRVRAAIVATVAVTAGITSGVIISAIALEAEVAPTITPFVVLALSAAAILVALRLVRWAPREVTAATPHPSATATVPSGGLALLREAGLPFVVSCAGMAMAWMVGGSFLALGAIFARRLAGIHDPAVAALTVAVFQIVAGCAQLGGRNLEPRRVVVADGGGHRLGRAFLRRGAADGSGLRLRFLGRRRHRQPQRSRAGTRYHRFVHLCRGLSRQSCAGADPRCRRRPVRTVRGHHDARECCGRVRTGSGHCRARDPRLGRLREALVQLERRLGLGAHLLDRDARR